MIIAYFILAHLVSDFLLQPTKLFIWKNKSMFGVFTHVLIHMIINSILLLPILINGYLWLLYPIIAICFIHFFIDQIKVVYDSNHKKKVLPFLFDQTGHFLTIIITSLFIRGEFVLPKSWFYDIYSNVHTAIFISLLILSTVVVEIYRFQYAREKNPKAKLNIDCKKMILRTLVLSLAYIIFLMLK